MRHMATAFLLALTCSFGCGAQRASQVVEATSESGRLLALLTPTPDPPVVGQNRLRFELRRVDGTPLSVETLSEPQVSLWMPSHGHGSSEEPVVRQMEASAEDPEVVEIEVDRVRYVMAGRWQVSLEFAMGDEVERFVIDQEVQ